MTGAARWTAAAAAWMAGLVPAGAAAAPGGLGLPPDASAEGWRIDRLLASTHVLVGAVAAVALGGLVWAALRHRDGRTATYTHGTSRRAIAIPIAAATVVFVVVDGNLLVTSTRDLIASFGRATEMARRPDAVRIQVSARQWAWQGRYAGPDGRFATADDVAVTDRFRIPRGRPVVVQLASLDVVHAFHLPSFRVKTDAIPGQINTTWFRAEDLGTYEIACAQHCGVFHHRMRGLLEVVEDGAFRAWIADRSADAVRVSRERDRAEGEAPASGRAWPEWSSPPETGGWPWRPEDRHGGETGEHDHD